MPDADRSLTDAELLAVMDDDRADLSLLSRDERHRLVSLTSDRDQPAAPTAPADDPMSTIDRLLSLLPMAGGMAGGVIGGIGGTVAGMGVGGVPGAIGGAALGGGLGESLRQLANRARGEEAPATPMDAARGIGTQAAIQGGAEAAGGAVMRGAQKGARAVYRGYLKPSLAAKNLSKAPEVVETALNEALTLTQSGGAKAQRIIGELKAEVDRLVASTPGTIDLKQIADRVRAFAKRKYYKPGGDPSDYQAALGVAERLDTHPALGLPPGAKPTRVDVSLSQANEAKRALQSGASSSFGVPNAGAKKAAEKKGAYRLRQGIEAQTGGPTGQVAKLNARESKLIDAARAIRQAVEREANQNKIYGVKTLMAGVGVGGGSYARGDDAPTALAKGAAARALLTPGAQSLAAIVANRIAKGLGVGTSTATRLAEYVLSESEEQPEQ